MLYVVRHRGIEYSQHTTMQAAVKRAAKLDHNERMTTVVAVEISGTYRSETVVWPTHGETWTN